MKFKIEYYTSLCREVEVQDVDLPDAQAAHDWAEEYAADQNLKGTYVWDHYILWQVISRPFPSPLEGHKLNLGRHSIKPWYETKDIGNHDLRKQADNILNEMMLPEPEDGP